MKKFKRIALTCLACSFIAILYWENGRTIFENRRKPSEEGLETINMILVFEQEKLSECIARLSYYDDQTKELGIEIKPVLERKRAVNHQGLVEKHDFDKDVWLPKYYSSEIVCYVYKNGKKFTHWTPLLPTEVSLFTTSFKLIRTDGIDNIRFYESPFDDFDESFNILLAHVSNFL